LRKVLTLDQLHDEGGHRACRFEPINMRDVRMIERRKRLGLALEPGKALGIFGKQLGQNLEGDIAPEPGVVSTINFAHTASADSTDNGVGAEASAGGKTHEVASL
jgi:hypothetical protein